MRLPFVLLLVVGCQNMNVGDAIGAGNLAITTTAQTITAECGNTQPGGECLPGRMITTLEKEQFKERLSEATQALDDAENAYSAGRNATRFLNAANAILSSIKVSLARRGIE